MNLLNKKEEEKKTNVHNQKQLKKENNFISKVS